MQAWNSLANPQLHPKTSLCIYFAAWKLLLLTIARFSPGPGYDISGNLSKNDVSSISILLLKLMRWDAIYFTNTAHRGVVYEQEWAFGWGYTQLLRVGGRGEEG